MGFEQDLKELKDIADRLESSDLSLEEGIALFEKGLKITGECLTELNVSREKIKEVRQQMDELWKNNEE